MAINIKKMDVLVFVLFTITIATFVVAIIYEPQRRVDERTQCVKILIDQLRCGDAQKSIFTLTTETMKACDVPPRNDEMLTIVSAVERKFEVCLGSSVR